MKGAGRLAVSLALSGVLVCCATVATGQTKTVGHVLDREALKGLKTVILAVEDIPLEVQRQGVTETAVRADVELRLRQSGLRVVDLLQDAEGIISVSLDTLPGDDSALPSNYFYVLSFSLLEKVTLQRSGLPLSGRTYFRLRLGRQPTLRLGELREALRGVADEFCNDYLAANSQ